MSSQADNYVWSPPDKGCLRGLSWCRMHVQSGQGQLARPGKAFEGQRYVVEGPTGAREQARGPLCWFGPTDAGDAGIAAPPQVSSPQAPRGPFPRPPPALGPSHHTGCLSMRALCTASWAPVMARGEQRQRRPHNEPLRTLAATGTQPSVA